MIITKSRAEEVTDDLLKYLDENKHNASGCRFHWKIGNLQFWIANGPEHLRFEAGNSIPEALFPLGQRKRVWDVYQEWLLTDYKWKMETKDD